MRLKLVLKISVFKALVKLINIRNHEPQAKIPINIEKFGIDRFK